jgi:hypothetical protein
VFGAIAMPVAGVVTGVGEMVGGIANTPGAVSARLEVCVCVGAMDGWVGWVGGEGGMDVCVCVFHMWPQHEKEIEQTNPNLTSSSIVQPPTSHLVRTKLSKTPAYIDTQGRTWDPIQRQWVKYSLTEEAARVAKEEEEYQREQVRLCGWVGGCECVCVGGVGLVLGGVRV